MNDTAGRYSVTSAVQLIKNVWNHLMGTFDGIRLTLYVNGSPQGTHAGLAAFTPRQMTIRSISAAGSRSGPIAWTPSRAGWTRSASTPRR